MLNKLPMIPEAILSSSMIRIDAHAMLSAHLRTSAEVVCGDDEKGILELDP